jgi:GT2 family glycosyltransferase
MERRWAPSPTLTLRAVAGPGRDLASPPEKVVPVSGAETVRSHTPERDSHPFRGHIPLVGAGIERPLWSVMIPTYNCARFLEETLRSVLCQAPDALQMQIQVVDDHSLEDDPRDVVQRLAPSRVEFFRQPQNVGHSQNFDTCIRRARGHLVHILHGDDLVNPGFYQALQSAFEAHPEIGAAFCRVSVIDGQGDEQYVMPPFQAASGIIEDASRVMAVQQPVETPSIAVRRAVYERLGGFDNRLRFCGEDLEMWVRISAHYPIWYEAELLARYRTHGDSLSRRSFRTGQNIRDVRRAIDTFGEYLPRDEAREISSRARERVALWALAIAEEARWKNDPVVLKAQVREALFCSRSPAVLLGALDLATHGLRRRVRSAARRVRKTLSRKRFRQETSGRTLRR